MLAVKPRHEDEIGNLIHCLAAQVEKDGTNITLGRDVTVDSVREKSPDTVIVATGVTPILPQLAVGKGNVAFTRDILSETVEAG